jgi:hypothetical protein
MTYRNRLIDTELRRKLDSSGAVLIRGPKSCGKTESALRAANSVLRVDIDENVPELKLAAVIDTENAKPPKSLNIITGTGISHTRNDGVNVISPASLGA